MGGHKSIAGLSDLYTVVVGLALALGVGSIVGSEDIAPEPTVFLTGAALIVTLIPFYHGGLRHLQETYADDAVVRPSLILWDFVLLFLEACLLLAAAASLGSAARVGWLLVVLWVVDIVWVTGSRLLGQSQPSAWAFSNIVAVAAAASVLLVGPGEAREAVTLLVIAVARTVADYALSRDFYFSADELGPSPR